MTKSCLCLHAGESAARDAIRSPSEASSRIASIETSISSSAVVPLSEASSSGATESSSLLSNLGIEWPAAIFATTGSTVMAMGQHVLSTPAVWNRLISLAMKDIHIVFCFWLSRPILSEEFIAEIYSLSMHLIQKWQWFILCFQLCISSTNNIEGVCR
jgi:hypothetical protein